MKTPPGPERKDNAIQLDEEEARQGATGHNVRYVLLFGLGGVIIAFVIVLALFNPFGS
jgi:hypothetical protein